MSESRTYKEIIVKASEKRGGRGGRTQRTSFSALSTPPRGKVSLWLFFLPSARHPVAVRIGRSGQHLLSTVSAPSPLPPDSGLHPEAQCGGQTEPQSGTDNVDDVATVCERARGALASQLAEQAERGFSR